MLQIWMLHNLCAAIAVLGQWQSKPQIRVKAIAEARVEAARREGFGRCGKSVLVWSQAVAIYPESGGWCGAQTCQAALWLHGTWWWHCLHWGVWTVGFSLPGGEASSGFCAGGTGDRASVTVPWAMVVGSPVHCQVVFAGLWLRRVSGCGLGVGLGWCLPGRGCVGFPVAGQGPKSGWDVPGCGCVGFPVAARGSILVGVYRVVVASGVGLRAGGQIGSLCTGSWVGFPAAARGRIGLVCTGSMLRRFSDCGPGVESGQYVPGRGRVGFPVMAGGQVGSVFARSRSSRVTGCGPGGRIGSGWYVPDRGSGFRLRAGVKLGRYVPGHGRVGFPIVAGGWVGSVFSGRGLQVAGCKCGITVVRGGVSVGVVSRLGLGQG